MTLHCLQEAPPPWLLEALECFEERFTYPLGEGVSFRISHGREYVSFFQAMGEATVWVAERGGEVLGTLAAIRRTLHLPGGQTRPVAYVCDLKVLPERRGGIALAKLARTVTEVLTEGGLRSAYAVVMGGTVRTPLEYTGRIGVPQFDEVGKIVVLKVVTAGTPAVVRDVDEVGETEVDEVYRVLQKERAYAHACRPELRSLSGLVALRADGGRACGVVEDTRRGKRLWLGTGEEIMAAHLSRFAYVDVESGAGMIRGASVFAVKAGFPAMFVAVSAADASALVAALAGMEVHVAPATVYGVGLPSDGTWSVDTSEI